MVDTREPLQPIVTARLFPKLEAKLIEVLRSIAPEEARPHAQIAGDEAVGLHILKMISLVG